MEKVKYNWECAYKEIYEILKIFPKELVEKIPASKIDYIKKNMDKDYEYNVTVETFDGKTMLDETAAILAVLFKNYWATPKQREQMEKYHNMQRLKLDQEAREKYDPENVFKERDKIQNKEKNMVEEKQKNLPIEIPKETIIQKIKRFINKLLRKKHT